ncbi:MAG: ABC transporter permease [Steroidobacteraceae bacterium]|nr:ABC transporter permease [Steroidobacteraceae bacterium]
MIGVAGFTGVFVTVLAMATGLTKTFVATGDPARAIVLAKSAQTEGLSNLPRPSLPDISDAPGVLQMDGKPVAVGEHIIGVSLLRRGTATQAEVTVRGTTEMGFTVHPEWRIVAGRMFRPGLKEIVAGVGAAAEFEGLAVGDEVVLGGTPWKVVGHFASNGDSHESELLADEPTLTSELSWPAYSSITVRLDSPDSFEPFSTALRANPSLEIDILREQDYYREQSRGIAGLLHLVSTIVGAIMAAGVVFTAINTMSAAVASRTTEIAVLRALGFGSGTVALSVLMEAVLLSLVGALLGAAVAWLLFNGNSLSTVGGQFGSQVRFNLLIEPRILLISIACACLIGLLGGLIPAIRAAKLPVATALRPT